MRQNGICSAAQAVAWKRIYLTEGAEEVRSNDSYETEKDNLQACRRRWKKTCLQKRNATCGECVLKKFASLDFGKQAKSMQKTLAIPGLRQNFKLDILIKIAYPARATYYYHEKQLAKIGKYKDYKKAITTIYHENKGRYRYRRSKSRLKGLPPEIYRQQVLSTA